MKTIGRSITVAALAAMAVAACESTPTPPRPMETIEDTVEVSASVEKVDVLNRLLTLKTQSGEVVTIEVGPEVQNLVQIRPGDRVVARYREAIGATISAGAAGQPVTVDVEADRARLGQRPSARASATTNVPGDDQGGGYRYEPGYLLRRGRPRARDHRQDAASPGIHQAAQARRQCRREFHRGDRIECRAGEIGRLMRRWRTPSSGRPAPS